MLRRGKNRGITLVAGALASGGLAVALTAGPASAQAGGPPSSPGLTPGVATVTPADGGSPVADLAYTAANGSVYIGNALASAPSETALGGHLLGGPAVTFEAGSFSLLAVFGRGTDNALWWDHQTAPGTWSGWQSLGGRLTSKPAAAADNSSGTLTVAARGVGGEVWQRSLTSSGWGAWTDEQGLLLAGTAPAVAYDPSGHLLVVAVGVGHDVYLKPEGTEFGFNPLGGKTNDNPAVSVVQGTKSDPNALYAVAFVRGTNNALWTELVTLPLSFSGPAPDSAGWKSYGGALTSGVAAQTQIGGSFTYVFGLGTDNQFWARIGGWPTLGPWQHA